MGEQVAEAFGGEFAQGLAVLCPVQAQVHHPGQQRGHERIPRPDGVRDQHGRSGELRNTRGVDAPGALAAAGHHHHRRPFRAAQPQPPAGRVQRIDTRVKPFEVLVGGLHDIGEGHKLFGLSAGVIHVRDDAGAAIGVKADGGGRVGALDGGKHLGGAGRQHGGDGTGVQQRGSLQQERQARRDAGKLPGEVERVGGGPGVVDQRGGHAGGQLVGPHREQHGARLQVRGQGLAVGIPAVAANELDRMVQPRQPHRHVEGAAADMGLDAGGTLDDINQPFANYCEHGHTLPENPVPRRVLPGRAST